MEKLRLHSYERLRITTLMEMEGVRILNYLVKVLRNLGDYI